jgi:hypothetical protein
MRYQGGALLKYIGILLVLVASPCSAEVPLKEYLELREVPQVAERLRGYFTGVGRGIFWSNVEIATRGMQPLFCMPENLALDEGIIQSLLDQEIRSPTRGRRYSNETSVELILINAFIGRFPCGR